jgi:hypothetical protein
MAHFRDLPLRPIGEILSKSLFTIISMKGLLSIGMVFFNKILYVPLSGYI